jgi:hypothetical protein
MDGRGGPEFREAPFARDLRTKNRSVPQEVVRGEVIRWTNRAEPQVALA